MKKHYAKSAIFFLIILIMLAQGINLSAAFTTVKASFDLNTTSPNNTYASYSAGDGIIHSSSVMLEIKTAEKVSCRYSIYAGTPYEAMEQTFDYDLETIHRKSLPSLEDGSHTYYIRCKNDLGNTSAELTANFKTIAPVSANIELPKNTYIGAGKTEISLTTSKEVQQTPSLSYTLDNSNYENIPLMGSGRTWKGYLIISSKTGEETGYFKFSAKDLDGITGDEIRGDSVFIIDTIKPLPIFDIKLENQQNAVSLKWHFEEEVDHFNLYRSTSSNPTLLDFYKTVTQTTYIDTGVEKGRVYYYSLSAVDKAGNEGELSQVVSGSPSPNDQSYPQSSSLSPELVAMVDNSLTEINSISSRIQTAEDSFNSKTGLEKEIFQTLEIKKDIDSANSEIAALKKEVAVYKSQALTKAEIEMKLNSISVKLSAIKKKVPESILVKDQAEKLKTFDENKLDELILEIYPTYEESARQDILKNSKDLVKDIKYEVKTMAYNLNLIFLDGSRKEKALVKEEVGEGFSRIENFSLVLKIPQEITDSSSEIAILKNTYEVLKDNNIFSFSPEIKTVYYSVDKNLDFNSIGDTELLPIADHSVIENLSSQPESLNSLTGYFSFIGNSKASSLTYIIAVTALLILLASYITVTRRYKKRASLFLDISRQIEEAELLAQSDSKAAASAYSKLQEAYKTLPQTAKKDIYPKIQALYEKLKSR